MLNEPSAIVRVVRLTKVTPFLVSLTFQATPGVVAGHVDTEVDADLAGVFALELQVAETGLGAVAVDDHGGGGGGVGGERSAERAEGEGGG